MSLEEDLINKYIKGQNLTKVGSLYISADHIQYPIPPKSPKNSGFAIYIPYSELFGKKLPEKEIISLIKHLRASDGISSASKLGVTLENHGKFNRDIQVGIVYHLFSEPIKNRINQKLLFEEDRFLFFEQQLLNVVKLFLLFGSLYRVKSFKNQSIFEKFLTDIVLGLADHLEKSYFQKSKKITGNKEEEVKAMIEMTVRNQYFNSVEQFEYLMSRYYQLFFVIPKRIQLKKSPNYLDIENIFKKAVKFDLDTFYSLGFAILTQFTLANVNKGQLEPNHFFINKDLYFRNIKIKKRTAVNFLNRLSLTTKEFRVKFPLELKKTKNFYYSFILMRQKPLVRINKHMFFPSSLRFLKEKITMGIYWEIADYLEGKDKNKFFRFFGEIFEAYIKDIFIRMYPKNQSLNKCIFEQKYGKNLNKKNSDVMILQGKEAIFIEVNTSRLRMVESVILGDIDYLRLDWDKIIFNSAKQLNRVIEDFSKDEFDLGDISHSHLETIYPVILTLIPIPQVDLIWISEFNKKLNELGYFKDVKVAPLQLIDAEEIEMIEGMVSGGANFLDIVKNKVHNPEYIYKPMKNFLLNFYTQKYPSRNKFLSKQFDNIWHMIRKNLFQV